MSGDHHHHHHHGDHEGDHDDPPLAPLEENPIWVRDHVTLDSVGIDIGSAGTQVAFSRLVLRRRGEHLTSRWVVVRRDTVFESEIALTPFDEGLRIDPVALGEILDRAYGAAGRTREQVDTGVVILTGEALRRHNAEVIGTVVAERAGDLVCATAGHHMEAVLAAHGSGTVRLSRAGRSTLLAVDIGGGTTKLALVRDGKVERTAALHVGGRLVAHADGVLTRVEPGGRRHAARIGVDLEVGSPVEPADLGRLAETMADTVLAGIRGDVDTVPWLTEPLGAVGLLDGVVFSGGVGEFVDGREDRDFGDVGRLLGAALRRRIASGELAPPVVEADHRIRATVLGAAEYSVQLSGITSDLRDADRLLPRRSLQVVRPDYEDFEATSVAAAVRERLEMFAATRDRSQGIALALTWTGSPEYPRLRAFAEGILDGLAGPLADGEPVYLMLEADVALTLGRILRDELGATGLVVLDGIELHDFDYVDLGRPHPVSRTVPVTIKSLVFADRTG